MKKTKYLITLSACLALGVSGCDKGDTIGSCETANDCPNPSIFSCLNSLCVESNASHCDNNRLDESETDIDCGGLNCDRCSLNKNCKEDSDCTTNSCQDGICKDVECQTNKDCTDIGHTCVNNVCATCTDGIRNGDESDVDCGGSYCIKKCPTGANCDVDTDCASNNCMEEICGAFLCESNDDCTDGAVCNPNTQACESCKDNALNNDETDIDCGGPNCNKCPIGKHCQNDSDCNSNLCLESVCIQYDAAACIDGVKNGNETDIDCGGDLCKRCGPEQFCQQHSDCSTGICEQGYCAGTPCESAIEGQILLNEVLTNPNTEANLQHAESTKQFKYLEIYNNHTSNLNLAELKLEVVDSNNNTQTLQMSGCIKSKQYIVLHAPDRSINALADTATEQVIQNFDSAFANTTSYRIQLSRGIISIHKVIAPDMSGNLGVAAALPTQPEKDTKGYDLLVNHSTLPGEGGVTDNPHSPGVYNYAGIPQG